MENEVIFLSKKSVFKESVLISVKYPDMKIKKNKLILLLRILLGIENPYF